MIAYCGLNCSQCEAFLATKNNDDKKRSEIAKYWSKEYNTELKISDINCYGCTSIGKTVLGYCNICEIRKCGMEKKVENCAFCDQYPCTKLETFFNKAADAKKQLEDIRDTI